MCLMKYSNGSTLCNPFIRKAFGMMFPIDVFYAHVIGILFICMVHLFYSSFLLFSEALCLVPVMKTEKDIAKGTPRRRNFIPS